MTIKPTQLILPDSVDLSGIGLRQRQSFAVGRDGCKSIEISAAGSAVVTLDGRGTLHVLPSGAIAIEPEAKAGK
jgi:hypothetical protein